MFGLFIGSKIATFQGLVHESCIDRLFQTISTFPGSRVFWDTVILCCRLHPACEARAQPTEKVCLDDFSKLWYVWPSGVRDRSLLNFSKIIWVVSEMYLIFQCGSFHPKSSKNDNFVRWWINGDKSLLICRRNDQVIPKIFGIFKNKFHFVFLFFCNKILLIFGFWLTACFCSGALVAMDCKTHVSSWYFGILSIYR